MLRMLVLAAGIAALAACTASREFRCEVGASDGCVRGGETGQCVEPGYCAFAAADCDSGFRYDSSASDSLAGSCVELEGGENECGGSTILSGAVGDACGLCDSGTLACDGPEALRCEGELSLEVNATNDGGASVAASSQFSGSFPPELSVDNDLGTSWFSAGSAQEPGGESQYTWSAAGAECISRVTVIGNGQHQNPDFREQFGFAQVAVEVYDGDPETGELVFSETVNLSGTPDPDVVVEPEIVGTAVRLRFSGHESNDCGGFAELIVNALR